ncbi:hypothetical protein BDZ91DRAFT_622969, partial [Kalaharituber pfeilii]
SILNSRRSIGIHGYMLVYSIASKQSFEMVKIIQSKALNHLVGSASKVYGIGADHSISTESSLGPDKEGKALQQEWNCAWIETSARHNENVTKAFELMIAEVEKARNP